VQTRVTIAAFARAEPCTVNPKNERPEPIVRTVASACGWLAAVPRTTDWSLRRRPNAPDEHQNREEKSADHRADRKI
jgi:hypothetical protein